MAPFSSSNIFHHHSHLHRPPGICWWLPCVTMWKRANDQFKHIQMQLPQLWRNLRIITPTAAFSINSDILLSYLRRFLLVTWMTFFVKQSFWGLRQFRGWQFTGSVWLNYETHYWGFETKIFFVQMEPGLASVSHETVKPQPCLWSESGSAE